MGKNLLQMERIIKQQREMIVQLNNRIRSMEQQNNHLKDCIISVREQTEREFKSV